MDELLHHWQISLISQGRVWVYPHAHLNTHTDTYECMHTEECVWTRTRSYTHAFYQSNLIGKSMLWLANRELMQSRGLSSSLPPPVSIFTYLSLMSFSSPLVCSLSFSFVSSCGKQLNNICTQSAEADETRPADWWSQQQSFFSIFRVFVKSYASFLTIMITTRKNGCIFISTLTITYEYWRADTFND